MYSMHTTIHTLPAVYPEYHQPSVSRAPQQECACAAIGKSDIIGEIPAYFGESSSFLNSFHPQVFSGTGCVTIVVFAVPSAPPEDVRCAALSSQSLQVSWHPPPHIHSNGAVQGYRLSYDTSDQGIAASPIIEVEEALFGSVGGVFLEKVQITKF